jgi:hypothetical protein
MIGLPAAKGTVAAAYGGPNPGAGVMSVTGSTTLTEFITNIPSIGVLVNPFCGVGEVQSTGDVGLGISDSCTASIGLFGPGGLLQHLGRENARPYGGLDWDRSGIIQFYTIAGGATQVIGIAVMYGAGSVGEWWVTYTAIRQQMTSQ